MVRSRARAEACIPPAQPMQTVNAARIASNICMHTQLEHREHTARKQRCGHSFLVPTLYAAGCAACSTFAPLPRGPAAVPLVPPSGAASQRGFKPPSSQWGRKLPSSQAGRKLPSGQWGRKLPNSQWGRKLPSIQWGTIVATCGTRHFFCQRSMHAACKSTYSQ